MAEKVDYDQKAQDDAKDMVKEVLDDVLEQLKDDAEADKYYSEYDRLDDYHHQSHVDIEYSLLEAAELLDALSKYEESDRGLWEGMGPKNAVICQAAYTYGNAVAHYFKEIIEAINADADSGILHDMLTEMKPKADEEDEDERECSDEMITERIKEIIEDY